MTPDPTKKEIKPCPFCGGAVQWDQPLGEPPYLTCVARCSSYQFLDITNGAQWNDAWCHEEISRLTSSLEEKERELAEARKKMEIIAWGSSKGNPERKIAQDYLAGLDNVSGLIHNETGHGRSV